MNETSRAELSKLLKKQLPASRDDEKAGMDMLEYAKRCVFGEPEDNDRNDQALAVLDRMAAKLQETDSIDEAAKILEAETDTRQARPLSEIKGALPKPLLTAKGQSGPVLIPGNVCLLAGEGGVAKSALALSVAVGMAALGDGETGDVSGGLFEGVGGPVLMATFEDLPSITSWRARHLVESLRGDKISQHRILQLVHVLDLAGRPLFGPTDDGVSLYNARPGPLAGWIDLWTAANRIRPKLIVIDPALSAYVGEANAAAPVREFLGALVRQAGELGAGVLLLAHSNKAARQQEKQKSKPNPFDPGQVSGSTAWTDGVRGVLAMNWGESAGERVLAVAKANYGPSRIQCLLDPVRHTSDAIVGFKAGLSGWQGEENTTAKKTGGGGWGDPPI